MMWGVLCVCPRLYEGAQEGALMGTQRMLQRHEEEMQRLTSNLALQHSHSNLLAGEEPSVSLADLPDPRRISLADSLLPHRKTRVMRDPLPL